MSKLNEGKPLYHAAAAAGMDTKTARKYRQRGAAQAPKPPRGWKTRQDPFSEVWDEVEGFLHQTPALEAKTLFEYLLERYPGRFQEGQLRTLQRKIRSWRSVNGPAREAYFPQIHQPGELSASDFTNLNFLKVTLDHQSFDHMVYHFVLTYSNWESVTLCFSESFESLSTGFQNAVSKLGGVSRFHRTDSLSAAVNNLSDSRGFTRRYEALMSHYGVTPQRIQPGKANENGDVEQSHHRFQRALDQALLLRGSRNFQSREEYEAFLQDVVDRKNRSRAVRFAEERPYLRELPSHRLAEGRRLEVRVSASSTIHVLGNTYSVHSRLIGQKIVVMVWAEALDVHVGDKHVDRLPRLRGRGGHRIHYLHIIDQLVKKPGAMAAYRYRSDLFPNSRFRMAYDALEKSSPGRADRQYLRILQLAAAQGERSVDAALKRLLGKGVGLSFESVEAYVNEGQPAPQHATDVSVEAVDLSQYDGLVRRGEDQV